MLLFQSRSILLTLKKAMSKLWETYLKAIKLSMFENQSRMCFKEVGLGLFPSDSLVSQSYDFDKIALIGP